MDILALTEDRPGTQGHFDTIRALLHDLRGPVAVILALTQGLGDQSDHRMKVIGAQANWMASLVEAALDEGGHDEFDIVDVSAVADLVGGLSALSTTCEFAVEAALEIRAWARPVALARALSCILDNAIRAAGPDGTVVVRVTEDLAAGSVDVSVIDNGPGPGRIASRTSLGLTTTRAMVAACDGAFRLYPGSSAGAVAEIRLQRAQSQLAAG